MSEAVDVKDTFQSDMSSLTEKGGDKLRKLRNTSEIPAHTVSGDTHYTWPCINGLERTTNIDSYPPTPKLLKMHAHTWEENAVSRIWNCFKDVSVRIPLSVLVINRRGSTLKYRQSLCQLFLHTASSLSS